MATSKPESETVEGRLADLISANHVLLLRETFEGGDTYVVSADDARVIVDALRTVATAKEEIKAEIEAEKATQH